jgi:hypothetical protein
VKDHPFSMANVQVLATSRVREYRPTNWINFSVSGDWDAVSKVWDITIRTPKGEVVTQYSPTMVRCHGWPTQGWAGCANHVAAIVCDLIDAEDTLKDPVT